MAIPSCRLVEATKKHQKSQYLNVLNHETEKERKYVVFASNNIIQDLIMKVMQINAVYAIGSTGYIVSDIHTLSIENGIDSYVAYSMSPLENNEIINGYRIGNSIGKKLHALLGRINGKQAYFSKIATWNLLKYIEKIKPDVVHLHNLHSNFIYLNMLLEYLAKNKIKTIITLHDCWFYTGGCFHYTSAKCDRWLKECGHCPKKNKDTPALLFDTSKKILKDRKKYLGGISDLTIVGVSEWISHEAQKSFLGCKKIITIHNGIDTDYFKPSYSDFRVRNGISNEKFVILGIANKWLLPINQALLTAMVDFLDEDMTFVLIGCTEKQREMLPQKIKVFPFISDRSELRNIYSSCDVFTNCTWEESLSLVNVEAQACGTPVVTYSNTGVYETVDDMSGFKVRNGDIKGFLDAIQTVKNKKKQSYSKKCREFVLREFNKGTNYKKYLDLYKNE